MSRILKNDPYKIKPNKYHKLRTPLELILEIIPLLRIFTELFC